MLLWGANAVQMAIDGRLEPESFGAVVADPPYIKHEHLSQIEKDITKTTSKTSQYRGLTRI